MLRMVQVGGLVVLARDHASVTDPVLLLVNEASVCLLSLTCTMRISTVEPLLNSRFACFVSI